MYASVNSFTTLVARSTKRKERSARGRRERDGRASCKARRPRGSTRARALLVRVLPGGALLQQLHRSAGASVDMAIRTRKPCTSGRRRTAFPASEIQALETEDGSTAAPHRELLRPHRAAGRVAAGILGVRRRSRAPARSLAPRLPRSVQPPPHQPVLSARGSGRTVTGPTSRPTTTRCTTTCWISRAWARLASRQQLGLPRGASVLRWAARDADSAGGGA